MKRTTPSPLNQEPDRNSLTFSIPRGLIPIPILSHTEQMIIARITSLSNKYSTKGGCNLPNEALAYRQECNVSTVSVAISKATWLGMLQCREDSIDKHANKDGTVSITQRRRIKLVIPKIWEYFGELWADFYFKGDEEAKQILDWMKVYVRKAYEKEMQLRKKGKIKEIKTNDPQKLDLLRMIKRAYKKFQRGGLENPMTPFIDSKGALFEDSMLLMFSELNVSGIKCSRNTPAFEKSNSPPIKNLFLNLFPNEWTENPSFQKTLQEFIQHRKEKKQTITELAAKKLANKLSKYSMQQTIDALNRSIENGWTGVFPENKDNGNDNGRKKLGPDEDADFYADGNFAKPIPGKYARTPVTIINTDTGEVTTNGYGR
jgi:hypothetical protein